MMKTENVLSLSYYRLLSFHRQHHELAPLFKLLLLLLVLLGFFVYLCMSTIYAVVRDDGEVLTKYVNSSISRTAKTSLVHRFTTEVCSGF